MARPRRGSARNCLCSAKWRAGDDGGGRDGWMGGCLLFAPVSRSLARAPSLPLPLESLSAVFAPSKCKFMSSSFFFSSSSLPKYRRRQSDGRRALNDDGDDEARLRALARPCVLLLVRSPCLPPSVKCAPVILSKSRMPKRGFLDRDRHPGRTPE